jgi:hypothetical protein
MSIKHVKSKKYDADEAAFMQVVEHHWKKYDRDCNGYLDHEEFMVFAADNSMDFPKEDI